jgi:hypothetical protein
MDAVSMSEDYIPNARLSPAKLAQQKTILDMRRELALAGLRRERTKHLFFGMAPAGLTMLVYGFLFAASVLGQSTTVSLVTDLIAVFATLSTTYYIAALHQEPKADATETGRAIAEDAFAARLIQARERMARGEETPEDLDVLRVAAGNSAYHTTLVRQLRRPDNSVEWLTASDCYARYDAATSSAQSTLRRRVRELGKAGKHGVEWDEASGRWKISRHHLDFVFPPEFLARLRALQTPDKTRTIHRPRGGVQEASPEPSPDTIRTPSGAQREEGVPALSLN